MPPPVKAAARLAKGITLMSNRKFEPFYGMDDTLGGRISLARDARDITIDEAAKILGVQADTWSAWENDRDEPRASRIDLMAGLLQVSVTWLLSGRGSGPQWHSRSAENR